MISICVDMSKGNIFKRIRPKVALFQIEKLENSKKEENQLTGLVYISIPRKRTKLF